MVLYLPTLLVIFLEDDINTKEAVPKRKLKIKEKGNFRPKRIVINRMMDFIEDLTPEEEILELQEEIEDLEFMYEECKCEWIPLKIEYLKNQIIKLKNE